MPEGMTAYLTVLAALAVLRLWELARSKRNWGKHSSYAAMPRERLFPWMVVLHTSFFLILPLELWWRKPSFGGPLAYTALVFFGIALVLRFWTLRTIGASWNVRVVGGQGYPIVSDGPYRYIRHPNYVVVALELLFFPLIFDLYYSACLLTVANLAVLSVRIRNEEEVLSQNPDWVKHMAHKPRFMPTSNK